MLRQLLALAIAFCAAAAFAAVDVNKATQADLDGVKGVGPGLSTRILDERKKGEFKDWNDFIDRVRGVGQGNAGKFSANGLTVNGASYKRTTGAPDTKDGKSKPTAEREERRKLRDEARQQKAEEAMAKDARQDKPAAKAEPKLAKAKAKPEETVTPKN